MKPSFLSQAVNPPNFMAQISHLVAGIFFILLSSSGISQTNPIPNAGFELWNNAGAENENPAGWGIATYSIPFVWTTLSAVKTNDAHTGDYAIQMESTTFPPPPTPGLPIPGVATSGPTNLFNFSTSEGFAYSEKPNVLKGFYKYFPENGDTGKIAVILTYTFINADTTRRDTLVMAEKYFRNSVSEYTAFFVPLAYDYSKTPDSVIIAMYASQPGSVQVGSRLLVDDLELVHSYVGIADPNPSEGSFTLWPNPAKTETLIQTDKLFGAGELRIFDNFGRLVKNTYFCMNQSGSIISLEGLSSGVYVVQWIGSNRSIVKKLIVNP